MSDRPLDRIDIEILRYLQENARISNKELATRVHLAPSTCLERVRALHERGAFRGFHADVEPELVGIGLHAITQIRLAHHTRDAVHAFVDYCASLPEVTRVLHVSGANDFLVDLAVRDADHLRDFLMDAFTTWPEVAHLETSLVFDARVRHVAPTYLDVPDR